MPYAVCVKCLAETYYPGRRGDRLGVRRCVCGGLLKGKGGRTGKRDFVHCGACDGRRERRNTRTLDVTARYVTNRYKRDLDVVVPAGTPICRYFHDLRVHAACCDRWVARHLTVPCGAVRHYTLRDRDANECPQCFHAETCCGSEEHARTEPAR